MQINITNGDGIIDIVYDNMVICLKIRKPIAANWDDCHGSIGQYFACTTDYEPAIPAAFNQTMIHGSNEAILEEAATFLQLFAPGEYNIYIGQYKLEYYDLNYEYGQAGNSPYYGYSYYPHNNTILFTQPLSSLDQQRIQYYEQLIADGGRPKAVVFQKSFTGRETHADGSISDRSFDSPIFVLDGHHKLMAYQNLQIDPVLVVIGREVPIAQDPNLSYFDYEYFLTDYSREHIISHNPQLLPDNADYNRHFDNYLKRTRRVEVAALELFKTALLSGDPQKIKWLLHRLAVLESRQGEKGMWLNYYTVDEKHPYGVWYGHDIDTPEAFAQWIQHMFGKSIADIKAMAGQ